MNILLLGAGGFIGQHLAPLLADAGHRLASPTRRELDFLRLRRDAALPLLAGQDVVVNMVGAMRPHAARLETLHHHAPAQLARWAVENGVRRWVQLSALGARADHPVPFLGSKGRGDDALLRLAREAVLSPLHVRILRPSLVFGAGGASAALFTRLARLPCLLLPHANVRIQPVHVADVARALARLATAPPPKLPATIEAGGAEALTLAAWVTLLRTRLHRHPAPVIAPLPTALLRPLLPLAARLTRGMVSADSLALLAAGAAVADNAPFTHLLGQAPRSPAQFFPHPPGDTP